MERKKILREIRVSEGCKVTFLSDDPKSEIGIHNDPISSGSERWEVFPTNHEDIYSVGGSFSSLSIDATKNLFKVIYESYLTDNPNIICCTEVSFLWGNIERFKVSGYLESCSKDSVCDLVGYIFVAGDTEYLRFSEARRIYTSLKTEFKHYMLINDDDVINIISSAPPTISTYTRKRKREVVM